MGKNQVSTKALITGVIAVCVLGLPLLLAHSRLHGPPCLFYLMFHIHCPGCGLTRSLVALWRADLWSSFRYHPLGLPLFLLCVYLLLTTLVGRFSPRVRRTADAWNRTLTRSSVMGGIAITMVGIWLLRVGLELAGNRFFLW